MSQYTTNIHLPRLFSLSFCLSLPHTHTLTQTNKQTHTQEQLGDGKVDTADLFRDLSAYLTLEKAEKAGFDASVYGLTDQQAADIAVVFNQYDTNQDGKLDVPEMQRLWYGGVGMGWGYWVCIQHACATQNMQHKTCNTHIQHTWNTHTTHTQQ